MISWTFAEQINKKPNRNILTGIDLAFAGQRSLKSGHFVVSEKKNSIVNQTHTPLHTSD